MTTINVTAAAPSRISALSPELKAIETEPETIRFTLQDARAKLLVKSVPAARRLGLARVRDIL